MASSDTMTGNQAAHDGAAAAHAQHAEQPEQDTTAAEQKALRDWLLAALAAVAGYADALSYVALGQIFVANITGSTVLLGLNLAQGHDYFALRAYAALGGFLVGVSVAALIVDRRIGDEVWPRAVTVALAVELGALVIFSAVGLTLGTGQAHGPVYALIALLACAMGLQSVAVRSLGVADITTTYITGTWVGLMAGVARRLRAEVDAHEGKRAPRRLASLYPQKRDARLLLVYIVAAALCGLLINLGARLTLLPLSPALALVVVIALRGFRHPARRQRK